MPQATTWYAMSKHESLNCQLSREQMFLVTVAKDRMPNRKEHCPRLKKFDEFIRVILAGHFVSASQLAVKGIQNLFKHNYHKTIIMGRR
jgi:hypothetical protein